MRHEVGVIRRTVSLHLNDLSESDIVSMLTVIAQGQSDIQNQSKGMQVRGHDTGAVVALKDALEEAMKSLTRGEVMAEPTRLR
jgi:hypothetical protein